MKRFLAALLIIIPVILYTIPGRAALRENIPENGWPYQILDQFIFKNILVEDPALYKRGYILERKQMALVVMRILSNIKFDEYHNKLTRYDVKQLTKLVREFEEELEYLFDLDTKKVLVDLAQEMELIKPQVVLPAAKTRTLYYEVASGTSGEPGENPIDNRFELEKITFSSTQKKTAAVYPESFNTPVTISVRDTSVRDILMATFKKINVNIVIDKDLNKTISLKVQNMPIKKLLSLLEEHDVYHREINGIYNFYSADTITDIQYTIEHLSINDRDIITWLTPFRSARGKIRYDDKSKTVFIEDGAKNVRKMLEILQEADVENEETTLVSKTVDFRHAKSDEIKRVISDQYHDAKIITATSTNSLIITAPYKQMKEILNICKTFDAPSAGELKISRVYKIEYAEVTKISEILRSNALSSGIESLEIATDERTNSIIITETKENLERLEEFISILDSPSKQVHIEAKIIEVNLSNSDDFGFKWQALLGKTEVPHYTDSVAEDDTAAAASQEGETYLNPSFNRIKLNFSSITDNEHQFSLGTLSKDQFNLLLTSLKQKTKTNILSSPSITTLNGKKATLDISEDYTIVYPSGKDQQGQQTNEKENVSFGIKLNVTPIITDEGTIKLEIDQEISNLSGYHDNYPIKSKRTMNTNVILQDGNTLMIAGLIQNEKTHSKEEVPLLSKIPFIGRLFKKSTDKDVKKETVIFITPKIVQSHKIIEN